MLVLTIYLPCQHPFDESAEGVALSYNILTYVLTESTKAAAVTLRLDANGEECCTEKDTDCGGHCCRRLM